MRSESDLRALRETEVDQKIKFLTGALAEAREANRLVCALLRYLRGQIAVVAICYWPGKRGTTALRDYTRFPQVSK